MEYISKIRHLMLGMADWWVEVRMGEELDDWMMATTLNNEIGYFCRYVLVDISLNESKYYIMHVRVYHPSPPATTRVHKEASTKAPKGRKSRLFKFTFPMTMFIFVKFWWAVIHALYTDILSNANITTYAAMCVREWWRC